MKTFTGMEVSEREVQYLLDEIKKAGASMTVGDLMNNLVQSNDVKNSWEIRISRVSARDLPKHDTRKFTDGNNNGKTLVVAFS